MKKLKAKWIIKTPQNRLYRLPVPVIGLTGGIATGKSTVSKLFTRAGFSVIDADKLVKSIYQKQDTIDFIKDNFPEAYSNGKIHFSILRTIVFNSEESKSIIEKFIYSYMPEVFLDVFSKLEHPPFVIYDVPLLFEKHLHLMVDVSICVYASPEVQKDRLIKRDQISEELAEKILSQQMSIEDKKNISDLVIENNGDEALLENNFSALLSTLLDEN